MSDGAEAKVAEIYDAGAVVYEKCWAPALHGHALDLLAVLPSPGPGESRLVLDIATGAGTLIPALHEVAGPAGRVLALDRSRGMLQRAPESTPRIQADAGALPLGDEVADVAVMAFVLFLLPDASRAVLEAGRVLRPRGWLLAATWGADEEDTRADDLVREVLDEFGAPAFDAPPRSDSDTDTPERMASLLRERGFTEVTTESRPFGARFDPTSFVELRLGVGVLGWRFSQLSEVARPAAREELLRRVCALPSDALVDNAEVLLTSARRDRFRPEV